MNFRSLVMTALSLGTGLLRFNKKQDREEKSSMEAPRRNRKVNPRYPQAHQGLKECQRRLALI